MALVYSYLVDDGVCGEVGREQARIAVEEWLANNRTEFSPPGPSAGNATAETWGMLPDHRAGMERAMQMAQGVQL